MAAQRFCEAPAFWNRSAGLCLTLEKSSWNQPYAGHEQHGRGVPQFLLPWMSFGMQILLVACWLDLLLRYRPHQTFQLQGHLRREPGVCSVYTGVARVRPFPHRSWKQQSNARPKLTSPTGWTHVEMLLESHCYAKQRSFPILDLVDS